MFPYWQVHRGYWRGGIRENTMEAFRQAKAHGAQMVELDVQTSREGVPHVFHDTSLKRFFHIDQKISKTSSEDLQGLNIPKLEDVLTSSEVPGFLNIEIKDLSFWTISATRSVMSCIQRYGDSKKILISSFNPTVLFWVRQLAPDYPRALIIGSPKGLMSRQFDISMKMASPKFINCQQDLIDDDQTRNRLIGFEKEIMVWTVNDYNKATFYLKRGAKSIISDLAPPPSK